MHPFIINIRADLGKFEFMNFFASNINPALCGRLGGEKHAPQSGKTQSAGFMCISKIYLGYLKCTLDSIVKITMYVPLKIYNGSLLLRKRCSVTI